MELIREETGTPYSVLLIYLLCLKFAVMFGTMALEFGLRCVETREDW